MESPTTVKIIRYSGSAILAALFSLAPFATASSAEWRCEVARYVTGGTLHLLLEGDATTITSVSGAVELSTARVAPPLGLRDGTFTWDRSDPNISAAGAVLSLNFIVAATLSDMPVWGVGDGMIAPTQLNFLLPALHNPAGVPVRLGGITLITGNGLYHSNNNWSVRGNTTAIVMSNAPDPLNPGYSRELLQLMSDDPNEPLSLFLSPVMPGSVDSIVSFHSGGLVETPRQIQTLLAEFVAAGGMCPASDGVPNTAPEAAPENAPDAASTAP
jgi:hypothetical protein